MADRGVQQKILETMGIQAAPPNPNMANRQTRINPNMVSNRAEATTRELAGDAYGGDGSLAYQSQMGVEQLGPDFYNLPFDKAMTAFSQTRNSAEASDMRLSDLWNSGDEIVRERITELLAMGAGMDRSDDVADEVMDEEMSAFIERLDAQEQQ